MKILVNRCYGGFSISDKAFEEYLKRTNQTFFKSEPKYSFGGSSYYKVPPEEYDAIHKEELNNTTNPDRFKRSNELYLSSMAIERTDPILIEIVEEMGEDSFGVHSEIEVLEIPDGIDWEIEEYDGMEHVAESHRTW